MEYGINLKDETLEVLKENGKTKDDIVWIGNVEFRIPNNSFWMLADRIYDPGFGGTEVADDLLIVGQNWWLERHEYDGSEWWEYKELPKMPKKEKLVETLFYGYRGLNGED